MANANRDRGGVAYYWIPSSKVNFLCHDVDKQISKWMHDIQVDEQFLSLIREAYVQQVRDRMGHPNGTDRGALERALKDLAEEELRCARQHGKKQLSDETWDILWREWQDQRSAIKATLEAMDRNCEAHIATLDEALRLIAKAGILFDRLPPKGQQDLLRHMVERVVISPEGQILGMDLRTPFSYLQQLARVTTPARGPKHGSGSRKNKTSGISAAGSSYVSFGAPTGLRPYSLPHPFTSRPPRPLSALRRHSSTLNPSA